MSLFYVVALGFAVSFDGFIAGVAYGLKNIRMPWPSLLIVGIVTCVCSSVAMAGAYILGRFMNTGYAIILGALLLILLGIWSVFHQYLVRNVKPYEVDGQVTMRTLTFSVGELVVSIMANPETADVDHLGVISPLEAVFLGLAVALDAMVAIFGAALMGALPLYTPLAAGIIHVICIAFGCYSSTRFISEKLKKKVPYLPGTILILLGIIRLG